MIIIGALVRESPGTGILKIVTGYKCEANAEWIQFAGEPSKAAEEMDAKYWKIQREIGLRTRRKTHNSNFGNIQYLSGLKKME